MFAHRAERGLESLGTFGCTCLPQVATEEGCVLCAQQSLSNNPFLLRRDSSGAAESKFFCKRVVRRSSEQFLLRKNCMGAGEHTFGHKERVRQFIRWLRPRGSAVRCVVISDDRAPSQVDPVLYSRLLSLITAACRNLKQLEVAVVDEPGVDWADVQHMLSAALMCPLEDLSLAFMFRRGALPAPAGSREQDAAGVVT